MRRKRTDGCGSFEHKPGDTTRHFAFNFFCSVMTKKRGNSFLFSNKTVSSLKYGAWIQSEETKTRKEYIV